MNRKEINQQPIPEHKPLIVVSAINIFQSGMLTVLKDCLQELETSFSKEYRIKVYVHKIEQFKDENFLSIDFTELPKSRKKWLYRLYYEYVYFKRESKILKPYLWLSLHDVSPFLMSTEKQCVYCHNPSVFQKTKLKVLYYDRTHFLFTLFYKFLYQINIQRNNYVIVQQDWIRQNFSKYYNLPLSKILVAYPHINESSGHDSQNSLAGKKNISFFYPAFPRTFKNFEIIIQAVKILLDLGITNFQVRLTIDGNENLYSKHIKKLYNGISNIEFIGKLSLDQVQEEYKKTDILIFPSTLETWGLPLSEFKEFDKPILAADLPYAHEAIGTYNKIAFFDPLNPNALADLMIKIISGDSHNVWTANNAVIPKSPFTNSWKDMLEYILKN